jgi:SAM-dependent methyltransferase
LNAKNKFHILSKPAKIRSIGTYENRISAMKESISNEENLDQSLIFDDYFEKYNNLMEQNLRVIISKGNLSYFAEHKMKIFRSLIPGKPQKILEYGCGIGNNLTFLKKNFPGVPVWGCDTSEKSLEVARKHHPDINFFLISEKTGERMQFDCILVSDVIHHIPSHQRDFYLEKILEYLLPSGKIVFFEHNPYNPLTRHFVNTCPFDQNAELISLHEMRGLLMHHGLSINKSKYCFYFPEFMRYLDRFEPFLSPLPIGGKYYVLAQKNP